MKNFKDLCTPAALYLVLHLIAMTIIIVQNIGKEKELRIGDYECDVECTSVIFVVKCLWIIFWTYILDLICKDGKTKLAWFIFLLPFVLLFIGLGLFMSHQGARFVPN